MWGEMTLKLCCVMWGDDLKALLCDVGEMTLSIVV